jgi:ribosome-binding protein aMBF1 (putative translation factor)
MCGNLIQGNAIFIQVSGPILRVGMNFAYPVEQKEDAIILLKKYW